MTTTVPTRAAQDDLRVSRDPITTPTEWRDGKRLLWLSALCIPATPFVAWGLVSLTGLGAFWWFGAVFVFVLLPLLDLVVGYDRANPPEELRAQLEADHFYRWATYAYLPAQLAGLVFACRQWSSGGLSWVDHLGLAVTTGIVAGVAINTAHELGHKREDLERWLAKLALAQSGYGHFSLEHNRGHHVRVATPEDPASSRYGEGFYAFLPRSVVGGVRSAVHLEQARLSRKGLRFLSPRNELLVVWSMTVVLFGALAAVFGLGVLPWLALQAVLGFSLLEVVNYLEHYGLLRRAQANGAYERVRPEHSWNSDTTVSNLFLYQLQRHSDHHANAGRRYQVLRSMAEAPQLPAGYAPMMLLAYAPPLWRRVMDPRLAAHYGGDLSRANIAPRLQGRVAATGR